MADNRRERDSSFTVGAACGLIAMWSLYSTGQLLDDAPIAHKVLFSIFAAVLCGTAAEWQRRENPNGQENQQQLPQFAPPR